MRLLKSVSAILSLALSALLLAGCFAGREAAQDGAAQMAPGGVGSTGEPGVTEEPQKYVSAGEGYGYDASGAYPIEVDAAHLTAEDAGRGGATTAEPMIIKNAALELRVKDVDSAIDPLRATVLAHEGEISELQLSGDAVVEPYVEGASTRSAPSYASIVIRVPVAKLEALTEALGKLGTVVSRSESSSDVTEQAIDMEARLKNLRAEEDRLRSFLERANKVSELLDVQRELSRVRGDIEAMDAQLTYLKRQVAKATLMVTLTQPGSVTGTESPWYRLREAFSRGVQGAIEVVEMLITLVVSVIPLAIVVGGFAWALIAGVRRRRRRRAASADVGLAGTGPAAGAAFSESDDE